MRLLVPVLLLIAAAGSSVGQSGTGSKQAPRPVESVKLTTKNGKLSLVVPKGWTKIDPADKIYKEASASFDAEVKKEIESGAVGVELMAMDFESGKSGFADNVNVVDSGEGTISSDSDLEGAFPGLNAKLGGKLKHKIVKLPLGRALCYWGTISISDSSNDLIGYAFEGKGRIYVITFSTLKGKVEKLRPIAEKVMKTVKVS